MGNSYGYNENVIEFIKDAETAGVTLTQGRYKSRIEKLAKEFPEECKIISRNKDGSLFAHVPVTWIKINPPRQLSELQLENARNALEIARAGRENS